VCIYWEDDNEFWMDRQWVSGIVRHSGSHESIDWCDSMSSSSEEGISVDQIDVWNID